MFNKKTKNQPKSQNNAFDKLKTYEIKNTKAIVGGPQEGATVTITVE